MFNDPASGSGWFKIWEDGYDTETEEWCVDRLIQNNGLLSVDIPQGLPSGYYLFRPELLALHSAVNNDPQYYVGCAQVFIESGPDTELKIPDEYSVSIPGYVDMKTPSSTFNIYTSPLPKFDMPGPKVYIPTDHNDKVTEGKQKDGVIPSDCILRSANWCAKPVPTYSDETSCWKSVNDCWAQNKACWAAVTPAGGANCYAWQEYCEDLEDRCHFKKFDGPPKFYAAQFYAAVPGPIPKPYGEVADLKKKKKIEQAPRMTTTLTSTATISATAVAVSETKSTHQHIC